MGHLGTWRSWLPPGERVRLGVSACLLGQLVRYDGTHQRNDFLVERLGPWVAWVDVCPEVELGLGTPRPTLRLERREDEQRLVVPSTGEDLTDAMRALSFRRVAELAGLALDGYVLKRASPSCGMERVKVHARSSVERGGRGLFAAELMERLPELPVEEEGRLSDARLRDWFVTRVFCHQRWRSFLAGTPGRRELVDFHRVHKLLLQAHDEETYRELGRVVASFGSVPDREVLERYGRLFRRALARRPSRGSHVNVLQHLLGHVRDVAGASLRRHLLEAIEEFRRGWVPLVVPLDLLRLQLEEHGLEYPGDQIYLDPYPRELALRNYT